MKPYLLAGAMCLAATAALADAPRPPEPGCTWQPYESAELGLRLLVQDCADPNAKYVFSAKDGWLEQHRPADDRTFGSHRIIRVLTKPASQSVEAAIHEQFVATLPDKAARASCKVAPAKDTAVRGKDKQVFELVPTGAYEKTILRELRKEPRDFGCGEYGKGQAAVYFEYHPAESKTRFLWVDAGQDTPLFDENSITFTRP